MMLKRLAAVLFIAVGALATQAAQAAKPAAQSKPAGRAAQRERTPAQEARDEWNRGAIAYRTGKFAEAQKHFERVRELDPKFKDVRLYIARSIGRQYRPGVEDPENVAKGEEAVAAFEALLAEDSGNDEAFRSLVTLLTQMRRPERVREAVLRRANDASLPAPKRAEALLGLVAAEMKCARDVTDRRENRETVEQGGKAAIKYKMPADTGEFYRAQQCATNGLSFVDHALQLTPDDTRVLAHRAYFMRELSKLAEMEGNTGQKDFYEAQFKEISERLRALGAPLPAPVTPPPNAIARPQASDPTAQPAEGAAGAEGVVAAGILNSKAINKPMPSYPEEARAARAEGTVTVQVVIDEQGNVISATAVSGPPALRDAAVTAARQARFSPTLLKGEPVKVSGIITYTFALQ